MKKILSIIITLSFMLLLCLSSSFAQNISTTNETKSINIEEKIMQSKIDDKEKESIIKLIKKYGLKAISEEEIPNGIDAFVANTSYEIEKYLLEGQQIAERNNLLLSEYCSKEKKTKISTKAQKVDIGTNGIDSLLQSIVTVEKPSNSDIIKPLALAPYTESGSRNNSTYIGFNYYLNLTAYYTYMCYPDYPNNDYFISANGASSYLTGYHALVGWTQTSASSSLINRTAIHAQCTGTWDTYIIVPGVGAVLMGSSPGSWSWDNYFIP